MKLAFAIIQILIGITLLFTAKSDIQLLPGLMILINGINFYILAKK